MAGLYEAWGYFSIKAEHNIIPKYNKPAVPIFLLFNKKKAYHLKLYDNITVIAAPVFPVPTK